jgi:hypothetical protein
MHAVIYKLIANRKGMRGGPLDKKVIVYNFNVCAHDAVPLL